MVIPLLMCRCSEWGAAAEHLRQGDPGQDAAAQPRARRAAEDAALGRRWAEGGRGAGAPQPGSPVRSHFAFQGGPQPAIKSEMSSRMPGRLAPHMQAKLAPGRAQQHPESLACLTAGRHPAPSWEGR